MKNSDQSLKNRESKDVQKDNDNKEKKRITRKENDFVAQDVTMNDSNRGRGRAKLQSRLERRLPTGCIEIPVALLGIRVFVHVALGPFASSSRSIIFASSLWRDTNLARSKQASKQASDEVKGENVR